jgi:hypothetical protein
VLASLLVSPDHPFLLPPGGLGDRLRELLHTGGVVQRA